MGKRLLITAARIARLRAQTKPIMRNLALIVSLLSIGSASAVTAGSTSAIMATDTVQVADADSLQIEKFMQLSEIVVKGNLPNTRIKGNAMVTRVEGTALASGMANEMLPKVPGLTGTDDAVEVLGKGAPLIYINGRLLRDMSELKRIKSEDIRDVEVINNPGAQYDATVKAVVRIRTRRTRGEGFGFDLTAANEQDLRYGFARPQGKMNMNYRKDGFDIFGGVYYWHQDYRQLSTLEEVTLGEKTFTQTGPYTMTWEHDNITYTAGANWQINDNHSVGVRADLSQHFNGLNRVIYDEDLLENGALIDHLYSEQTSHEKKPLAWLTNAYYNGKVGQLAIDWNFDFMNGKSSTSRVNNEVSQVRSDVVNSSSAAKSNLYATKLVLSHPLAGGTIEGGTEMTIVGRHNTYNIDSKTSIANTDADITENTIAAFAEYSRSFDRYGTVSAGLRYEHTLFDYKDHLGSDNLHRVINDFFPSVAYSVMLGSVQTGLSYGVKTARPDYFALNDAITYISRYSLQQGNSKLKNETLHELTLNAAWKWLTFTASYEYQKNAISQWAYILDGDVALIKHINLGKPINNVSAFVSATPRWGIYSLNATAGVQKQWFSLVLDDGREMSFNKPIFLFNMFNTLSFKHNWKIDVNLMVRGKGHAQNFYNSYNNIRLGLVVQKGFLNNDLTVRVAVLDALQRNRLNEYGDMGYYTIQQNNRYSTHKLMTTLMYRFNTTRSKYKGTGAGKDAQSRMKR